MADGFNETPIRGKHLHNAGAPTETALAALPAIAGNIAPAYTEGNVVALSTDLAGNLRVSIAGGDENTGTLGAVDVTDRVARELGVVSLDAATITALESIDLNAATIAAISSALDEVGIDAASRDDLVARLTASIEAQTAALLGGLENVTVGGTVALDAATLAALENVGVTGTVALDAATLGALENTTVTVNNAVALDAATIDAINAGNDAVTITNFPAVQDVAGTVALDAATLAALDDVTSAVRNPTDAGGAAVPLTVTIVGGADGGGAATTVALDAATITALNDGNDVVALDAGTITALTAPVALDAATIDAINAGNDAVTITNFPANQAVTVTDPVALDAPTIAALTGPVALDAATLAALEDTTVTVANFPANQAVTVTDPVALDAATVTALTGPVALDAATLAALDDVTSAVRNPVDAGGAAIPLVVTSAGGTTTVGGEVALDAATLAALEAIDLNPATIDALTGPVALDAATLAALEATTATVVNATDAGGAVVPLVVQIGGDAGSVDVTGTVALDAATIAALNDGNDVVTLGAPVALDAATIDALNAGANPVALDAGTLAALESIDLNLATRDDLVTRITGALESVDLNAATLTALTAPQALAVRGAAVDDENPVPVVLQTNPGVLVDSGILEVVNVAPGAAVNLDGPAIAAAQGRLVEITASASVRLRVEVATVVGGVVVGRRVFFVKEGESFSYSPADRDAFVLGTGGFYRLTLTNMDNLNTANVYGSVSQVEA